MHLIFVKFRIKAEHVDDFKTEIARHIAYTKQHEPGCVQFDVATDKEDPRTFYLVEMYRDDQALTEHRASASLPIFRPKIEQWAEVREAKQGNIWTDLKS
jgi:quinol monooxygenase YgiN